MEQRMERRLDTWLETGRQLVDGVSGRRPGQRRTSLDLDSMGRWVGEKVDWLLDDDDDWREPWQEQTSPEASRRGGKRPLQAVSRRRPPAADDSWPEDESFRLQRWQRTAGLDGQFDEQPVRQSMRSPRRVLPRSSRRRD
ncbi:viral RNA helicase/ superfamily I [Synechococcus sp. A15-127]|uniref:hypothetical protein n=1 Tax=Synechococcus sp. A15-127 TaxID=1050624 RepID=UPI001645BD73|nr:hypothetical protein [Synechococcus sp. A15-127]QNI95799.1 viral RNA helicase/ superfamily I [Synechococcus sp. A15-127]